MRTNELGGTFIASLFVVSIVASTGACTDGESTGPYTVEVTGDPARVRLALAQDGDGVWQSFTLDAEGHASFDVTHGYHGIAYACSPIDARSTSLWVTYSAGAPATPVSICPPSSGDWHTVEGDVVPATASVYAGWQGDDLNDGGHYQGAVLGDRADLVGLAGNRMLVVHDVDVLAGGGHLLDVTANGFDLATAPITVSGVPAGATSTPWAELHTTLETYVYLPAQAGQVALVPAARRVAGDRVVVGTYVEQGDVTQSVQLPVTGDVVPALALPAAPLLELDRDGVRWDGTWEAASASLRDIAIGGTNPHVVSEYLRADAAWIDAHGDSALAWIDPTALPGWDPAWAHFVAGATPRASLYVVTGPFDGALHSAGKDGTLTW